MTHCTTCGHQIHTTATSCSQCGVVQRRPAVAAAHGANAQDPLWLPVVALVFGLVSVMALLAPAPWSARQTLVAGTLRATAIALGCTALARQERGQAIALAGATLGTLGVMGAIVVHLM